MEMEGLPVTYKEPFQPFVWWPPGHVAPEEHCTDPTSTADAALLIPVTTLSKHVASC